VTMYISKRFILLFFCLTALTLAISTPLTQPVALAAGAQFTITGQTGGRSGTAFHIEGSGFTPDGSYNLYTTTDEASCTTGDPDTLGLQAFTPATVTVSGGSLSQDLTWPGSISQAGKYYLCLVNATDPGGTKTVSSNTFTLAADVTLSVSPTSVTAGQSVTLSGKNWLPVQQLNIAVIAGNGDTTVLVGNTDVLPDAAGSFAINLTIPDTAKAGRYGIQAYAVNDKTLMATRNDSLTIKAQATPTPTPTPQPSPTPTATAQPSPTPTSASAVTPNQDNNKATPPPNSEMGGTNMNLLIFGMAGLGVLFILIGAVIFAVSMQMEN